MESKRVFFVAHVGMAKKYLKYLEIISSFNKIKKMVLLRDTNPRGEKGGKNISIFLETVQPLHRFYPSSHSSMVQWKMGLSPKVVTFQTDIAIFHLNVCEWTIIPQKFQAFYFWGGWHLGGCIPFISTEPWLLEKECVYIYIQWLSKR